MENFCYLNKFVYLCNTQNNNFYNSIICVVFELFVVEVIKRHFCLNFVTSRRVQAIIDFHLLFVMESFVESYSSLTILIDQLKGQHGNMLEYWHLESLEIVGTGRYWIKAPPSAWL